MFALNQVKTQDVAYFDVDFAGFLFLSLLLALRDFGIFRLWRFFFAGDNVDIIHVSNAAAFVVVCILPEIGIK